MRLRDRVIRTFITGYVGAFVGGMIAGPVGAAVGFGLGGVGVNLPTMQLLVNFYQAFRLPGGIFGPKGSTHQEIIEQRDENTSDQDAVSGVAISSSYSNIVSSLPAPPSGANTPRSSLIEEVGGQNDRSHLEIALQDADMQEFEFENEVFTPIRSNTP